MLRPVVVLLRQDLHRYMCRVNDLAANSVSASYSQHTGIFPEEAVDAVLASDMALLDGVTDSTLTQWTRALCVVLRKVLPPLIAAAREQAAV